MGFLKKQKIWLLILILFLLPFSTRAALLYFEPSSFELKSGQTFILKIEISTQKDCINAVKINLKFPKDLLIAKDFSDGDSILTLWPESPLIDQEKGEISFTGGIPKGYCEDKGLLGKVIFQAKEVSQKIEGKIKFLDNSLVLLNDGFGSKAKLEKKDFVFSLLPEKVEIPKDVWQETLKKDKNPPEKFELEIRKDPLLFGGKYVLIFNTRDKESGISHFEVAEQKMKFCFPAEREKWERAKSPYLIKDQSLKSIIKVKAVDKAGNERIVTFNPCAKYYPLFGVFAIVILGTGIIFWWFFKMRKEKKLQNYERKN